MNNKKNNETINVDYSAETLSAIKAEAKRRKISLSRVIEEMTKNFLDRCGTPQKKDVNKNYKIANTKEFFCAIGAVHPRRITRTITITETTEVL